MADQDIINISARLDPDTKRLEAALRRIEQRGLKMNLGTGSKGLPLGRFTAQAEDFTSAINTANQRLLAFGAGAGVLAAVSTGLTAIVTNAIKVQKTLVDLNSILNTSQSGLEDFGNSLFDIAKNTGQSFDSVAQAAQEFARQGKTMKDTLESTSAALILARTSGLDTVKSVEALTATINSFSNEVLTSIEVVNKLANVDAKFAVSSKDLADGISRVGSVAQDSGVSLDELIALITAAQQKTARGGAVIAQAFNTIFNRETRGKTLDQLEALGIGVKDLQGNINSGVNILQQLADKYDTLGDSQKAFVAETVGGVRNLNVLKATLDDLSSSQSVYKQALETSRGSTDQAIQRNELLNKSLSALANSALQNFTKVSAKVGELTLGPSLQKIFESFNSLVDNFDGDGVGGKLGGAILKGIGNALSGPGLAVGGVLAFKLFGDFGKYVVQVSQSVLKVGEASGKVLNNQAAINSLLLQQPDLQAKMLSPLSTTAALQREILGIIEKQTLQQSRLLTVSSQIARNVTGAGLTINPNKGVFEKGQSSGYVPPKAAMQEKIGAYAAGYAPGQVNAINIPGVGKSYYNSAETIKQFPGFAQPAILPPQESKAGSKYKTNFQGRFGFDPYSPNFAKFDTGSLKNILQSQGVLGKQLDIGTRNKKQIEAALLLSKKTGVPAKDLLLDPNFQTKFRSMVPNFARNPAGFLFGTPPTDFPGTKVDPYTSEDKINQELSKMYKRLLEINTEQQQIVLAKKLKTLDEKIAKRKSFKPKNIKSPFGLSGPTDKFLRGGASEVGAAFTGAAFFGLSALLLGDILSGNNDGSSSGFLPNFSIPALTGAVNRELQAGVPSSLIRIGKDSKLVSPNNPTGSGIYNVRDEPHGLKQGIKRAYAEGLNPKTYGTPNFAPLSAEQLRQAGNPTDLYNLLSGLSINDLRSTFKGINPTAPGADFRKNKDFYVQSLLTAFSAPAGNQSAARSIPGTSLSGLESLRFGSRGGIHNLPSPRIGVGQPRTPEGTFAPFPAAQPPALRFINPSAFEAGAELPFNALFKPKTFQEKKQDRLNKQIKKKDRISKLLSERLEKTNQQFETALSKQGIFSPVSQKQINDIISENQINPLTRRGNINGFAERARVSRKEFLQQKGFQAGFGIPFIAGAAASFIPEGHGQLTRGIEGIGNAAGLGATALSLGATGPASIAIGSIFALKTVIDNIVPSFEDLSKKAEELSAQQQKQVDALNTLLQITGRIEDFRSQGAGEDDSRIKRLQQQQGEALSDIGSLNPEARKRIGDTLNNPNNKGGISQVLTDLQNEQFKDLSKARLEAFATNLFEKRGGFTEVGDSKRGILGNIGLGIKSLIAPSAARTEVREGFSKERKDNQSFAGLLLNSTFTEDQIKDKNNSEVTRLRETAKISYEDLIKGLEAETEQRKLFVELQKKEFVARKGTRESFFEFERQSRAKLFNERLGGIQQNNSTRLGIDTASAALSTRLDLTGEARARSEGALALQNAQADAAQAALEAANQYSQAISEVAQAVEEAKTVNNGVGLAEAEEKQKKVILDAAQDRAQAEAEINESLKYNSEKIRVQTDAQVKAARQQDNQNFLGGVDSVLNPQNFKSAFADIIKGSQVSQRTTGIGGTLGLAQGLASGAQGFAQLFPGIKNPFADRLQAPLQSVFESRLNQLLKNPSVKRDPELTKSLEEARQRIPEAVQTQIDTLRNNNDIGNNISDIKSNTDGLVPAIKALVSQLEKSEPNSNANTRNFGFAPNSSYNPPSGTSGVDNYAVSLQAVRKAQGREVNELVKRGYSAEQAKRLIYLDNGPNGPAVMNRVDEPRGYVDVKARNFAINYNDLVKTLPLSEGLKGKMAFNRQLGNVVGAIRGQVQTGRRLGYSKRAFDTLGLLGNNKDAILNRFINVTGQANPAAQKLRAIFGQGLKSDFAVRPISTLTDAGVIKRAFGLAESGAPKIPQAVLNTLRAPVAKASQLASSLDIPAELAARIRSPGGGALGRLAGAGGRALGVFGGALGALDTVNAARSGDYLGAAASAGQTALGFAGPLGGALSFLAKPTADAATGIIQAVQTNGLNGLINPNGNQITDTEKRLADINAKLSEVRARNAELKQQLSQPPSAPTSQNSNPATVPPPQFQTSFGDINVRTSVEADKEALKQEILGHVEERLEYAMSSIPKENKKPLPPKIFSS